MPCSNMRASDSSRILAWYPAGGRLFLQVEKLDIKRHWPWVLRALPLRPQLGKAGLTPHLGIWV